jgi:uncharacterized protein YdbL (DUF1318 family)
MTWHDDHNAPLSYRRQGERLMYPNRLSHHAALLGLAGLLAACVPVTVNISFPQDKLEGAARQIEEGQAAAPRPSSTPAPSGRQTTASATPVSDLRSPEVVKARDSRRERRPALREWKNKGCVGEDNKGFAVARPGEGCGPEVADLIRAENADRQVIYDAFVKENKIPQSDMPRVQSAFARARHERSRPNDWVQLDDGQWIRKQGS